MLNRNALKGEIVRNGMTQKEVAEKIGMSEKTFITKMKNGTFGIDDCDKMIAILGIKKPTEIFFAKQVT